MPLSEENKETNNHLGDKLIYHFFPPLIIGVLGADNSLSSKELFSSLYSSDKSANFSIKSYGLYLITL